MPNDMPQGAPEPAATTSPTGPGFSARLLIRVLLAFVIGSIGAATFVWIKAPLPIFLGALTFCLVASVLNAPIDRPAILSIPVRTILGVTIGSAFSPHLIAQIPAMTSSLVFILPYSVFLVIFGVWFFETFAKFDRPTAFFASVPGGLSDMVTMAGDLGANQRAVTLIHATRIVLLVFLVPLWLQFHDGVAAGGRIANLRHIWDLSLVDGAVLVVLAYGGFRLAKLIGLAGAPLVGPMLLSAIVHAAGLTTAKVPSEVLIFAQVTLGILLGCQFRGITMREVTTLLVWGVVFAVLLVGVTIAATLFVSAVTGFNDVSIMLSYAPGGQNELNLLALILGLDVAFIALHHLVRLAIVFAGVQLVVKFKPQWWNRKP